MESREIFFIFFMGNFFFMKNYYFSRFLLDNLLGVPENARDKI